MVRRIFFMDNSGVHVIAGGISGLSDSDAFQADHYGFLPDDGEIPLHQTDADTQDSCQDAVPPQMGRIMVPEAHRSVPPRLIFPWHRLPYPESARPDSRKRW